MQPLVLLPRQGRAAEAIPFLEQYVSTHPPNGAACTGLGVARASVGDANGAVAAFQCAVRADPSSVPFRLNLANALLNASRLANAEQEARAAVFAAPSNPAGHEMLARVLAALGFKALATTSSGFAFTLGRVDGGATLDEVIAHAAAVDRATDLPLSVDLENGYGPDPESVALAIRRVAEAGAVGASIEDYDPAGEIYDLDHAVERVAAAVEAARATSIRTGLCRKVSVRRVISGGMVAEKNKV